MIIPTQGSSQYLTKADIDAPFTAVIDCVAVNEKLNNPYVLHFEDGNVKPLPLNLLNRRVIVAAYGDDDEGWRGKTIEIYVNPDVTNSQGQVVGGVRLRVPSTPRQPAARPTPAKQPEPPSYGRPLPPKTPTQGQRPQQTPVNHRPAPPVPTTQLPADLATKHAQALRGMVMAGTVDELQKWRDWSNTIAFTQEQFAELDAAHLDKMKALRINVPF